MTRSIFGVTLDQPWPWALANPAKFAVPCRTLCRDWNPHTARAHGVQVHQGCRLALHASERWDEDAARWIVAHADTHVPLAQTITRGAIVAVGQLAKVTRTPLRVPTPEGSRRDPWARTGFDWYWCLVNIVPVAPVECAGDVGLWTLDTHVHEQLRPAYAAGLRALRALRALHARREGVAA